MRKLPRLAQDPQSLREQKELDATIKRTEEVFQIIEGPGATPEEERAWRERLAKAPPITDERVRRMLGLSGEGG